MLGYASSFLLRSRAGKLTGALFWLKALQNFKNWFIYVGAFGLQQIFIMCDLTYGGWVWLI
jgi:hypothetical protein